MLDYSDDSIVNVKGKLYISLDALELWVTNLLSTVKNESFECEDKANI